MVPAKDGNFGIRGNAESATYRSQRGKSRTNPTLTANSIIGSAHIQDSPVFDRHLRLHIFVIDTMEHFGQVRRLRVRGSGEAEQGFLKLLGGS